MAGRIVYVNGEWVDESRAKISVFDRGFLMADAAYEVTAVLGGKLIDFPGHRARLTRSLTELMMADPFPGDLLLDLHREAVARNQIVDGGVYLQVTRGNPGDRDFIFPDQQTTPQGVVMFTQSKPDLANALAARNGLKVISVPDLRWGRRDIKTVQLLYPSLAKMEAVRAGKDDAWMVQNGYVTESTAANAYIVMGKTIITHPLSNDVLHGITRASLMRFAQHTDFTIEERRFTIDEAKSADEAFVTSATNFVCPVVEIDGVPISGGIVGPVVKQLRSIYLEECYKAAI